LFSLGSFLKNTEVAQILGLHETSYVLIFTKNVFGFTSGDFSQTPLVTLELMHDKHPLLHVMTMNLSVRRHCR
jgi:hypothetical protein